ncbi:Ubiquitin carboxyl-terminal hydrolase isozyme L5 [Colletotrichum tanaceti]|uniref:Ubiquitin carboxyl-terminal hydrolase n=1 Tax=Colletotrichum tanaceti TaxID=1306861 RepID=A0A4U6XVT4_9PEZI|nr:Ubiquitin carboxyl-terminal hydrolase isozyme L5 [Colletotrichum tanaceti]TKW60155.1 Ubiquitin carboxyl-terminal hydrolase isozyme L5 [Colletotrichum tanaceti]
MTSATPSLPELGRRQLRSRQARAGTVVATTGSQPKSDNNLTAGNAHEISDVEKSLELDESPIVAGGSVSQARTSRALKRKESPLEVNGEAAMADSRRNPKRKATETATAATAAVASREARDYKMLLREALAPIAMDELQEWEGWCEVESEPAFFNAMLREMGVKDLKVQEVFSVDEDYVATLPQPVYGFIFLYQYFSENYEDDEVVDGRDIWFANQTTDNACATVAMTNILMNCEGVDLGTNLQAFKDSTGNLSTPLRGHALSSNTFIRSVHNSFTRRMDHLNADLFLETEAAESKKKRRRGPSKKTKRAKKQKIDSESGYHFIAYVPANGSVWELDGLKTRPVCLGPLEDGVHWANLVRPEIQARMLQFEESALSFNLLALCKSPLTIVSESLARTILSFELLSNRTRNLDGWKSLVAGNEQPLKPGDTERLVGFGIDLKRAEADPAFEKKVNNPSMEAMELFELYSDLVTQQKSLMGEYNAEIALMKEDEDRVQGRQKDHSPAINCWVQKLAEHGVLADWAIDV